jgi:DNA-binding MarR family transcriptional regulator
VLEVLKQFRELFRVSQQHFQRIEERCGVSGAQLWALAEIRDRPGLSVSELSQLLSIELPTASNLLARLGARKLVRRERSTPDQRVVRVFLTAEGERLVRRAPRPAQGMIQAALAKLPGTALKRLHDDLESLLRATDVRHPREGLKLMSEMALAGNGSRRKARE